jgi:tryptophan halogenase
VTVAEIEGTGASIEDAYAGTWPGFRGLLAEIGIDERVLVARGGGTLRLGQHRRGWGAGDFTVCFGHYGAPIDGVPFHQLWARAAAEGGAAAFQDYSTAATLARAGRFAEPVAGVPGYEAGLNFDPLLLRDTLRGFATAQGVRRSGGADVPAAGPRSPFGAARLFPLPPGEGGSDPAQAGARKGEGELDARVEGPRITRVNIGATTVEADLYIDATGAEARLLSALPGGTEIDSWSRWLPIDRALVAEAPPDLDPPIVDLAEAHEAGWRLIAPLASRTIAVHLFASLAPVEAQRAAFGAPNAREIAFAQGRRRRAWIGNCVAVGEAAAVLEPLGAPGLLLTAMTIGRIVASLPDTDFAAVELAEYNRRWAIDAELVRDFVIAHHATARREDRFGRAVAKVPPPEPLRHALKLFGERGMLPARDGDPARLDEWLGVLIGNGVVPMRPSAAAETVSRERFDEVSNNVRRAIGEAVARAPRHRAWLGGWLRR